MKKYAASLFIIFLWLFFSSHAQAAKNAHQHEPFAEKTCDDCHNSKDPGKKDLISSPPQLCYQCHDEYTGKYAHSPASVGACLFCHNPHESENKALLKEKQPTLCFLCHDQLEDKMTNVQNKTHGPAADNCTGCHDPHVSDISVTLLNKKMTSLCTECHAEEGITLPVNISAVTHKHKPVDSEKSCGNCHNPHASPIEAYLIAEPMDLCLQCHNEKISTKKGDSLTNIGEQLASNPYHHGPIKEKNCSGCHSPHGSDFHRILLTNYPAEFYTGSYRSDTFKLCYTCHNAATMEEKQTTTLTNFRDGTRNLHYLHVNRKEKGRTCKACHEPHASKQPKHIRDAVLFGKANWPLELQFQVAYTNIKTGKPCDTPGGSCVQSGGSCVACHARLRYDYQKK